MQIELKGRNVPVTDELRQHVRKRFEKVSRQVPLARLEIELSREKNPGIPDKEIAEATIFLKGCTLRATSHSFDMRLAIHESEEELSRQVKRYRDKRRKRREAHKWAALQAQQQASM